MSPTYAVKKGLRYHYYVSTMLVQGRKSEAGSVPRVPASELENMVVDAIAGTELPGSNQGMADRERVEQMVERIIVQNGRLEIHLTEGAADLGVTNPIVLPWSPQPIRRKHDVIGPSSDEGAARPIRAAARSKLLHGIAKGRYWLNEIMTGSIDIEAIARRESISERQTRMTISLAFLAPDIIQAAADATLPRGFGISRLTDLPLSWAEQRHKLGLPARA